MSLLGRLRKREARGEVIRVAVTGAGLIGRGTVRQVELMPGMRAALVVNRTPERAVEAYVKAGHARSEVVVSDETAVLADAIGRGRPAVTRSIAPLAALDALDAVVEVTGAVEHGAEVALRAIEGGLHVVMMNAETDATVGCRLKQLADDAGVVYTNSDGDQPGVLKRLVDFVDAIGLEVVAAINCKGFMDVHATPETIRPWAERQNTSLPMTTAFTDGTKMNIENAVLANATGLRPEVRGMHGVRTEMTTALADCLAAFDGRGLVDFTLGGDFGGGVFVIGAGDDPEMVTPYMRYLKMGDGPCYLFFRPYHLCHMETPFSIAEAVLDGEPTIAPLGAPRAEVVAVAKRDLAPGDVLDGIGGFSCYGEIDAAERADGMLPIGLAAGARVVRAVPADAPIPRDAVETSETGTLARLAREQAAMRAVPAPSHQGDSNAAS